MWLESVFKMSRRGSLIALPISGLISLKPWFLGQRRNYDGPAGIDSGSIRRSGGQESDEVLEEPR
jgi:hypothetical protein